MKSVIIYVFLKSPATCCIIPGRPSLPRGRHLTLSTDTECSSATLERLHQSLRGDCNAFPVSSHFWCVHFLMKRITDAESINELLLKNRLKLKRLLMSALVWRGFSEWKKKQSLVPILLAEDDTGYEDVFWRLHCTAQKRFSLGHLIAAQI